MTVTLHFNNFPSTLTVIRELPADFPVTTPLLVTSATFLLEVFHFFLELLPFTHICLDSPTFKFNLVSVILGSTIFILHLSFDPYAFAVMVTHPALRATTFPLL